MHRAEFEVSPHYGTVIVYFYIEAAVSERCFHREVGIQLPQLLLIIFQSGVSE